MREINKNISIQNYSYHLPEERIAKYPMQIRDESKLLFFDNEIKGSYVFNQITGLLESSDLLIFNNAKVIPARLSFAKESGTRIEIFCLEPHLPSDYNLAFQVTEQCEWKCMVGNLKKWKSGKLIKNIYIDGNEYSIEAIRIGNTENSEIIRFKWYALEYPEQSTNIRFGDILENIGSTPLPPYLNREAEVTDKTRYQTIYAKLIGSVAAPTAGLHFTDNVFKSLIIKGIKTEYITLHVGAGTFRPVKSHSIGEHEMHEEHFEIDLLTLEKIMSHCGRVIAVGTTTARTLESIYWIGIKLLNSKENPFMINQWETYDYKDDIDFKSSFKAVKHYFETNNLQTLKASTRIIIVPGYKFRCIQGLVTNFHQPQSTLLLLIAGAVGEKWREIYKYALENNFRFLSYGDSNLLIF